MPSVDHSDTITELLIVLRRGCVPVVTDVGTATQCQPARSHELLPEGQAGQAAGRLPPVSAAYSRGASVVAPADQRCDRPAMRLKYSSSSMSPAA